MEEKSKTFLQNMPDISRRSFVKGIAAASASAALYGCGKDTETEIVYVDRESSSEIDDIYYTKNPRFSYGAPGHNCGGRCISKAQLSEDGRIVRILTDEVNEAFDGTVIDNENRNTTQIRSCARCRGYKGRLYHPGRLRYPLKQTKERGDVTGFVRISYPQAIKEIIARLKAVQGKYGIESFHSVTANGNYGSSFQGGGQSGIFANSDLFQHLQGVAIRLLGGSSIQAMDYSYHQTHYMGGFGLGYVGYTNESATATAGFSSNTVAGCVKYAVLWGSNVPTTKNAQAYAWKKSLQEMKKRDPESKIIYIGPDLSDGGASAVDEWIQIRPYTDIALMNAMVYEMIVNTVDSNGQLKPESERWLDLDWIDTIAYGFFDSPEYYMEQRNTGGDTPGTISFTPVTGYTKISAVPAGKSWSAYIMGNDPRLKNCAYGTGNYVANTFTSQTSGITRNLDICTYPSSTTSKYAYKKDMLTPKSPEWAEKITGVPAAKIKELAKLFVDAGKKGEPLFNEFSGGLMKQANGCYNIFALQALAAISKNWGLSGNHISMGAITYKVSNDPKQITVNDFKPTTWTGNYAYPGQMRAHPQLSCTQWHNAIKFAFGDKLKTNGYVSNMLDWKENIATGKSCYDDGGVKALVVRKEGTFATVPTYDSVGANGITRTYYNYEGHTDSTVGAKDATPAGFRFLFNVGGNIALSQHMNTNDTASMYKHLPTYGYDDSKYNVTDMADAFYLVSFDNFMAPAARYSDYVLPGATSWEMPDILPLQIADNIYVDNVATPPGEAKATWDLAREFVREYAGEAGVQTMTGLGSDSTFKDVFQSKYKLSAYYGEYKKSYEEFLKQPFSKAKPVTDTVRTPVKQTPRSMLDTYLSGAKTTPYYGMIPTLDHTTPYYQSTGSRDAFAETETCPRPTGKFHVYSGSLVWRYENAYSKWHGHLPLAEQGQSNKDEEGHPEVYPIPMYFHYQDWFRKIYNLSDNSELNGRFMMTTSHDKYRSHSTHAENPYLRELSHSVENGELYSGNDSGYYAVSKDSSNTTYPALNQLIGENGLPIANAATKASYADIWVNSTDFADYPDGTLVKVENEIGAVYCVIRKTIRCVRGYVNLHEGCWYDPRVINGKTIDVGGCANTLMASTPSRVDHGNAQQFAMVKITKVR